MYALQEITPTADSPAQTLEALYTGQSELYARLKAEYGCESQEAARQHRVISIVEGFCRIREETESANAKLILDAFVSGSDNSQMFAAELAVHYVVYDVLDTATAARSLYTLLQSEEPEVFEAAAASATFLRDCEAQQGPYDELTRHCLQTPDVFRLETAVRVDVGRMLLYVVRD